MIKKTALYALCLILAFSVCVSAENAKTESSTSDMTTQQEEIPQEGRGGRMSGGPRGGMGGPRGGQMGEGFVPPEISGGENTQTEAANPPEMPGVNNVADSTAQNSSSTSADNAQQGATDAETDPPTQPFGGRMTRGGNQADFPGAMNDNTLNTDKSFSENSSGNSILAFFKEYFTPVFSILLLAIAFVFVIFYKRKKY